MTLETLVESDGLTVVQAKTYIDRIRTTWVAAEVRPTIVQQLRDQGYEVVSLTEEQHLVSFT